MCSDRIACLSCFAAAVFSQSPGLLFAQDSLSFNEAHALVTTYCEGCHQGETPAGALDLARFTTFREVLSEPEVWNKVFVRVRLGEMPPPGSPAPRKLELVKFVTWIKSNLLATACPSGISPGANPMRRLNRNEYSSTVRDLLNIPINAGHDLPDDGAGGEGFDNAAETLTLSPLHTEKYLDAARQALEYASKDSRGRETFLIAEPDDSTSPEQAARKILAAFLPRAFRRPVKPHEMDRCLALFRSAQARRQPFEESILFTLQGVMILPSFLFRLEEPNPSPEPRLVGDYDLASRLSYFLWGSMPDQVLFRLAAQSKLHELPTLREQAARMLQEGAMTRPGDHPNPIAAASRVHDFVERFVDQWLGTRELGRDIKPDPKLFPEYYRPERQASIRDEPILFVKQLLVDNRSLLDLVDADWGMFNDELRAHYGTEDHRGGLLGMAAVLAVSSYPNRTSPARRGKWILETFLGTPIPPQPDNVPALQEAHRDKPETFRERLLRHRQNPVCGSCHNRMDPLGFSLENYDVVGRWRTTDAGKPIDARGELPDGTAVNGPEQLKKMLVSRKDLFIRNLTGKMLGYALGRGLTFEDYCTVDDIVRQLEENGYQAHSLIQGIVSSVPFRYHPGTNPELAVPAQ